MPDEELPVMETYEHETSDHIRAAERTSSDAAGRAKGAWASSDGTTGYSAAAAARDVGISSADEPEPERLDHEPAPPHTGSGPWPDPPQ